MALSNISLWIRDAWAVGKQGCWRGAGVTRGDARGGRAFCAHSGGPAGPLFSQERVQLGSPWSELSSASFPALSHPQCPRRPGPDHSLALSNALRAVTEGAAPAAADGAGSHPCLGVPRRGPSPMALPASAARGRARCCQPAALRGDRNPWGHAGSSLRLPILNTSAHACAYPRAEPGLLPAPPSSPRGREGGLSPAACGVSPPAGRASVSPQQRGWPGSGAECWGCVGWSHPPPGNALPGRPSPPAGICHGVGAPSEALCILRLSPISLAGGSPPRAAGSAPAAPFPPAAPSSGRALRLGRGVRSPANAGGSHGSRGHPNAALAPSLHQAASENSPALGSAGSSAASSAPAAAGLPTPRTAAQRSAAQR